MPKVKGPTRKEMAFAKEYARTGNGTQSILKTYNTKSPVVAGSMATENLKKPKILAVIKSIADRIPDELLEQVHLEGLSATQNKKPDYAVRHKYLDSAYKIKGTYAPLEANIKYNPYSKEQLVDMLLNKIEKK